MNASANTVDLTAHIAAVIDREIPSVVETIATAPGGKEVLTRIATTLSTREREVLWAYLSETDTHELGCRLGIEKQTAHNYLAAIEQKLGFDSRTVLLSRVFSALLNKITNS